MLLDDISEKLPEVRGCLSCPPYGPPTHSTFTIGREHASSPGTSHLVGGRQTPTVWTSLCWQVAMCWQVA